MNLPGLDEVRWADLSHAYGPADDVPELLRGLTDADPVVRADAIDELYGNIWHQGTVYSSTAYAVPFLARIAADRSVLGRASVLGLLASISAGSGYVQVHRQFMQRWSAPDPRELDDQEAAEEQWVSAARNAVIDAGPGLLDLLDDDDVEVRRTLPYALGGLHEIAGVLAPRLASRFSGEPDEAARASILFGLAALGRGSGDPGLVSPVIEHARRGSDAERLAAAIVDAGSAGQEQSAVAAAIDDFVTAVPGGSDAVDSLAWPRGDGAAGMMVSALGGRPAAEFQLASRMYASADPAMRNRAVSGAGNLARQSRSATPACVEMMADAATGDDLTLRGRGTAELKNAFPACGPAAEALAANIGAEGRAHSDAVISLARLGDPRARPVVVGLLSQPDPPLWTGQALLGLSGDAGLLPAVLELIERLAHGKPAPATGGPDNRLVNCINWIGSLGGNGSAAVPVLTRFLHSGRAALAASATLGKLGRAAAAAEPQLRELLTAQDPIVRSHAAFALWTATGELGPVVDVAQALIDPTRHSMVIVGYLEKIGPEAGELAPLLLPNLSSGDEWLQVRAARAYFRLTGDTAAVLPVLLGRAGTQPAGIAAVEALGWLGHHASAVAPQLEQWLSQDERVGGISLGGAIEHDEDVQEIARATLAAIRQT
jgi:HEAT repeat protein